MTRTPEYPALEHQHFSHDDATIQMMIEVDRSNGQFQSLRATP